MPQIPARIIIISGLSPKWDDLEREESAFQETPVYHYHRNKQNKMGHTSTEEQSLKSLVTTFLADLAHANHSPHTCRAYATDLIQLCAFHQGSIQTVTADVLRAFFEIHAQLRPATRARKQAAVARFLTWAEQQELLDRNPMRKIDRVKLDPPQPRGVERSQIERILKAIPAECLRDRLFFRLLSANGPARRSTSRAAAPSLPETQGLQARAPVPSGKERTRRTTALPVDAGTMGPLLLAGRRRLHAAPTSAFACD